MAIQPWDDVFAQVWVSKSPDFYYPPRPTVVELDAAEAALDCRLPASYRAFLLRFGIGEVACWVRLDPVMSGGSRKKKAYLGVVGQTAWWREEFTQNPDNTHEVGPDFAAKLVAFGSNGGGDAFAFHSGEVTDPKSAEYNVYELGRLGHWKECRAGTFARFVASVADQFGRDEEAEEELVRPPNMINFDARIGPRCRIRKRDIKAWLAANANAARNLALAIREEKRWEQLPILGDALEEGGCSDEHVLRACRDGNPQADGEWVLAVLLGK